ncbi:hypothetical protein ACVWY5_007876 [Bradyrhizobium sp. USDA 3256]
MAAAALLQREQVGDDGKHDGADHPAENARDDAAEQQHVEILRQRAEHGAEHEADIEEQQQPLAVEAIGKAGGEDAGNAGCERVGRDRDAELPGRDVQRRHQDGAERRHDDEVEDQRELREGKQRDQERLVARKAALLLVVDWRGDGLVGHKARFIARRVRAGNR